MQIYDRKTGTYTEITQYGQGKLNFLYGNPAGRLLLKIVINPSTSRFYGRLKKRHSTVRDIPGFIEEYKINMSDFEDREYDSFCDFFTRKLAPGARPVAAESDAFISPADSKLLVYDITDDLRMSIKGSEYSVNELIGGEEDMSLYQKGTALVFRLCMDDYHRYCFPDDGRIVRSFDIKGKLHTVSSISKDYKIFKENSRTVSVLDTENFGQMIQIEVGALLVGRIVNRDVETFSKGEEKGYFEPGGSTVIILLRNGTVKIDDDILEQSAKGIETVVKYGERIGSKC